MKKFTKTELAAPPAKLKRKSLFSVSYQSTWGVKFVRSFVANDYVDAAKIVYGNFSPDFILAITYVSEVWA